MNAMKSLAAAMFLPVVACAVLSSQGAFAQGLPSVSYDGRHPVTLRYGDLSVTLDRAPALDVDRVPVVKGRVRGRVVFSFRIDDAASREPSAKARVVRLDPGATPTAARRPESSRPMPRRFGTWWRASASTATSATSSRMSTTTAWTS
jgi:hypothetical protein